MSQRGSKWLQTVPPRLQARVRLICFPHGGGGAQAYRDWAAVLPDWIEVLAIAPPGRGPRLREPSITDMSAMRREVADAITPHLDLPYAIFGHSVGALVAFEVAAELQARRLRSPQSVFLSAYAAPQVARQTKPMHDQPDDVLLSFLQQLGHDDIRMPLEPELRSLVCNAVRADFKLAETNRFPAEKRIAAPLYVLGGASDETVPAADLALWHQYAANGFSSKLFAGGHFYTETAREELLQFIAETISRDGAVLPRSVLFGRQENFPQETCLHEHFRKQAALTPNRVALIDKSVRLTFAELDHQSDLLARRFLAQGVGCDRLVGILMETSAEFVVAYLAALKAGGAYLPIPIATPDAAIADTLLSAHPVAIAATQAQYERLPEAWRNNECCTVLSDGWQNRIFEFYLDSLDSAPRPNADNLAYCVMSSGTTGQPKGILCPHRSAVNSYWWRYTHLPYGEEEREACNVFFVWEVLRPLLKGHSSHIIADDIIFDPRRLVAFLEENRITRTLLTPSLLDQVLSDGGKGLACRLPHLRTVILNGEVVTAALSDRFAVALPHASLINDYSISECHDVATLDLGKITGRFASRYLPVGHPMSNVNVYVLGDKMQPVAVGVEGEVYVGGDGIARGYLNDKAQTAMRFLPDPFAGAGEVKQPRRMFRTGDVGRILPDGLIEISGRSDFMVKLRGYSIVPGAIEAEIRLCPQITATTVVSVDNAETGQPDYLAAYVAGAYGAPDANDLRALREHLKKRLPQYTIPRVFVPLEALPIDVKTGKVDRKRLPEAVIAGGRSATSVDLTAAALQATLSAIIGIWQRVLAVPNVRPDDNFFDLGGHSLLAAEMTRAVVDELRVAIDVIDVFDHPKAAAYAEHVARVDKEIGAKIRSRRRKVEKSNGAEIAVIGMAGRFPGAGSIEELWRLVREGRSAVRQFDDAELRQRGIPDRLINDPNYVKVGAILDDVSSFDPRFWGLSEAEATVMDPQQRLFLECSWHALESAGHQPEDADGNIGIFAGCYLPGYLIHHLGAEAHFSPADPIRFHLAEVGNDKDYLASRSAYLMNLTGPAIGVQTSCSTGLVAIAQAAAALRDGQCDLALAGAASITFPQGGFVCVDGHIGTRSGICRAFDAAADGTILGDGIGVVVLRRLDEALADGDTVLAVIKGYAINNDGADKAGYSAPSAAGQSAVIARALDMADVPAETIGYIEAHGSGTHLGDAIEVRGLDQAFRRRTDATGFCALGSIKPNIGHSNIAAGVAGFIKAVLSVRHGLIPPVANFTCENPELKLATTAFRIPTQTEPWRDDGNAPRRAGVSSFGIGGTNCHVVIEQAPTVADSKEKLSPRPVVLPISAKSGAATRSLVNDLAHYLVQHTDLSLADTAATLQSGRRSFQHRVAVSGPTREALIAGLAQKSEQTNCAQRAVEPVQGIVFVFPGHGAQYPRMGAGLYQTNEAFRHHFDRCAAQFSTSLVSPLTDLFSRTRSSDFLCRPLGLQAAIYSFDYALGRALIDWGIKPAAVCGHSLGEYAAATIAGVLPFADAVRLVCSRAEGTAHCEPGGMLSLAVGEDTARELVAEVPGLALAAINSPRDAVVSGPLAAIDEAERLAVNIGIATCRLQVTRAFHSPMMRPAAEALREVCATVDMKPPSTPLVSNLTGDWWTEKETANSQYWTEQLLSPVLLQENAEAILESRPAAVLEVGPGSSLQRPLQRCATSFAQPPRLLSSLGAARGNLDQEPNALADTIAVLWETGLDIDWAAWRGEGAFQRVMLPGYPFERRRCWPQEDKATALQSDCTSAPNEARVAWSRMFHLPSWARIPGPPLEPGWEGRLFILSPTDGCAAVLAEKLESQLAQSATKVIKLRAEPEPGSYRQAMARLHERLNDDDGPARVVDLSRLSAKFESAADTVSQTASLCEGLASLRSLTSRRGLDYWLVTDGALNVAEEASRPWLAPLCGPVLVASQENPRLAVRLIDIPFARTDDSLFDYHQVRRIAEEIVSFNPRCEPLVAMRGRHRWVERFEPLPIGTSARERGIARLTRAKGPHVIAGGLGRIGLTLARRLTGLGCHVVLLSRQKVPERDWLQEEFCDSAALVRVETCDVTDGPRLTRLLHNIVNRDGAVGGIFHCAGLADLRYIEDTCTKTIAAESATKMTGTDQLRMAVRQLASATGQRPDFIMLFSSLAAILGGLGMAGYAAANRYLDATVAGCRDTGDVPWVSVNFDDWDFEYTKEQVGAFAHTRQGLALPPEEGVAAIEAILGEPDLSQVVLSATPLDQRITKWTWLHNGAFDAVHEGAATDAVKCEKPDRSVLECATQHNMTSALVLKAYAKVIGSRDLELDANFFELGGDSLLAAQLAIELRGALPRGIEVSIGDIFDYPTPRRLTQRLNSD